MTTFKFNKFYICNSWNIDDALKYPAPLISNQSIIQHTIVQRERKTAQTTTASEIHSKES